MDLVMDLVKDDTDYLKVSLRKSKHDYRQCFQVGQQIQRSVLLVVELSHSSLRLSSHKVHSRIGYLSG